MDDMTWMSSFYELPPEPSTGQPVLGFRLAAILLALVLLAVGYGGVVMTAWPQAPAPAGLAAADAGLAH